MDINTLSGYLKKRFGEKIYKLSLSSGCTCPNRDGSAGYGGCIFCSEGGAGDFAQPFMPVKEQINNAKKLVDDKFPGKTSAKNRKYIAYFQSFTNTYGDPDKLYTIFKEAAMEPEIAAVSIATRPDCIQDDILEMLLKLKQIKPVWIELGLQTVSDDTARLINRCYETSVFEKTYHRLKENGFEVIIHLIFGLPGENEEMMLKSVRYVSDLEPHPDGIKLQLLHILKNTKLAEDFEQNPFHILSLDEYTDLLIKALEIIPKDIVIHRLTGDGPKNLLIEPLWSADKKKVLNHINKAIRDH